MRRWWKLTFGLEMSILEIMRPMSLEGWGCMVVEKLREKLAGLPDFAEAGDGIKT